MLIVTASLSQTFESQLCLRNIPDQQRPDFLDILTALKDGEDVNLSPSRWI